MSRVWSKLSKVEFPVVGVGGVGWGGFRPNILSLLVLIEIRIRLKLGCDNKFPLFPESADRNDLMNVRSTVKI